MRRLSDDISDLYSGLGGKSSLAKVAQRASRVREMWAACVQDVILEHTNAVYIVNGEEGKSLIVYVDDSICASELNARRELIKLKLLQDFNEDIGQMKIYISRGSYKKNHPFAAGEEIPYQDSAPLVPLDQAELKEAEDTAALIDSPVLREKFLQAMVADLEGKKGRRAQAGTEGPKA